MKLQCLKYLGPALLALTLVSFCKSTTTKESAPFGRWLSPNKVDNRIRGGTTRGPAVEVDFSPNQYYQQLQQNHQKLRAKEKDRLAILAMSGPYRVSFEFSESFALAPDYTLQRPYRSWGTEYVYIIENRQNFISLQHIMVMLFEQGGEIKGPFVMKHWRQDWAFEKNSGLFYQPGGTFKMQKISKPAGQWLQTVYQVDDSPRYSNVGQWQHLPGVSVFKARPSWRPLPRRERTVRKDYNALFAENRFSVANFGWVHEQSNLKGLYKKDKLSFLANETGLNRYQRIKNFNFQPGKNYLTNTAAFWQLVRQSWQKRVNSGQAFRVSQKVKDQYMFQDLFRYAEELNQKKKVFNRAEAQKLIQQVFKRHVQ